ncbi:hypothetical protein FRC06_002163 [Ceratobasidium sp. 370]|nr:hypothetical protein FRC06_002163 [Ceratobasidium sp. 370]
MAGYVAATTTASRAPSVLPVIKSILVNSLATGRGRFKDPVRPLVEFKLGFIKPPSNDTDVNHNLTIFWAVHLNAFHCTEFSPPYGHYESDLVTHAIACTMFSTPTSIGVVHHEFFKPMPLTTVVFVLAMVSHPLLGCNHQICSQLAPQARSTLSLTIRHALWVRQFLTDLELPPSAPTLVYTDSRSAIALTKDAQFHSRSKHIDIRHHFICDACKRGDVVVQHIPGDDNPADLLTKALAHPRIQRLLPQLKGRTWEGELVQVVGVPPGLGHEVDVRPDYQVLAPPPRLAVPRTKRRAGDKIQFCIEEWETGYFKLHNLNMTDTLHKYVAHLRGLKEARSGAKKHMKALQQKWFECGYKYSGATAITQEYHQPITLRRDIRPDMPEHEGSESPEVPEVPEVDAKGRYTMRAKGKGHTW